MIGKIYLTSTNDNPQLTGPLSDDRQPWERAADYAAEFCRQNPTWQRICDLPDGEPDKLLLEFRELPKAERDWWRGRYDSNAERAWREFASRPCRVDFGHVDEDGNFWRRSIVPDGKNLMMVFETGGTHGDYRWQRRAVAPEWKAR